MCSIMGYCSDDVDRDAFMEGFSRTISRGPDDSRVIDTGHGLLGFHRPLGLSQTLDHGSYARGNAAV